jgi:Flp pilus assembly protein TadB
MSERWACNEHRKGKQPEQENSTEARKLETTIYYNEKATIMSDYLHDLRHAAQALMKNPVFMLVVMLALVCAIGVNTAIYNIVYAAYVRLGIAWLPILNSALL